MEGSPRNQNGKSWRSDRSAPPDIEELNAQFLGAAKEGKLPVLQRALHHGVDPNTCDALGQTALHLAAYHGHKLATEYLVLHGVDTEIAANDGMTAYHLAMKEGEKETAHAIRILIRDLRAIDLGHRPQSRDIHRRALWEKRRDRAKKERKHQEEVRNMARESQRAKKIRQEALNYRVKQRQEREEEQKRVLERTATEWKLDALGEKGNAIQTSFVHASAAAARSKRVKSTMVDAAQAFARGVGGVNRFESNRGSEGGDMLTMQKAVYKIQAFFLHRKHLREQQRAAEAAREEGGSSEGEEDGVVTLEERDDGDGPISARKVSTEDHAPVRAAYPPSDPETDGESGRSGQNNPSTPASRLPSRASTHSQSGYASGGDQTSMNRFGWRSAQSFRQLRLSSGSGTPTRSHIPAPPKSKSPGEAPTKPFSSPVPPSRPPRRVDDLLRKESWRSPTRRHISPPSNSHAAGSPHTAESGAALPPMQLQSGETSAAAVRRLASESLQPQKEPLLDSTRAFGWSPRERDAIVRGDATEGTIAADRVVRLAKCFQEAYEREHPEFSRMMAECSRQGTAGAAVLGEATVRLWLGALSLGQYADGLLGAGFDTMERLSLLESDDLDALAETGPNGEPAVIVKRGHRRHLLAAVQDLQEKLCAADLRNISQMARENSPLK